MKILITGADGFIGSHLTETLVRQGHEVRAFVLYNSFNSWGWLDSCSPDLAGQFEVFAGDIRDPHGVRTAMQGCDTVMHLAALIAIPYSYHSPDTYVDTNIKGTLNIVQAVRDLGVGKMIHTSTSEVYGTARFVPITEEHPLQGQSPYSASKIGADQIAMSFYNSFDTPVSIIRPFNTYGPRMHPNDGRVVSNFIVQALKGEDITIYGDGTQTRSFCYVDDLLEGMVRLMNSREEFTGPVNIGNPGEFTMIELAEKVLKLTGSKSKLIHLALPADDPLQRKPDISLARKELGWEPAIALEEGLVKTIEYFKTII